MKQKNFINLTMFDLLKGVMIILVIWGHSNGWNTDTYVLKIFYSVMMPFFFIASGFWLKKRPLKAGLESSVKFLLRPFCIVMFVINLIGAVHRALQHNMQEWVHVFLIPTLLVRSGQNTRIGAMWFVFALFLSWCLFYLFVNLCEEKQQMIWACLCGIAGGIIMPLELPFQIGQGLSCYFLVYSGYIIKKKKLLEKTISPGVFVLLSSSWVISILYGSMDFGTYNMKYGFLSLVGSLCGSFLVIKLFLLLNSIENVLFDAIKWIGRHSMWILCIHSVEAAVVPWKILFSYISQESLAGMVLQFVLRCILIGCIFFCITIVQKRIYCNRRK